MLANPLHCRTLTAAFTQALRTHAADHDRPLTALSSTARSISGLLAQAREQAAASAAPAYDELAIALRTAFEALWSEFGGDPRQAPAVWAGPH